MFYQDHEKKIYSPPGSDKKYDPLAVERLLTVLSDGHFEKIWNTWVAINDNSGDIKYTHEMRAVASADAEMHLVKIARGAFQLPDFPDCLDAEVLEVLRDYIGWMEGKGQRVVPT